MSSAILMYHEVEPASKVDKHYTLSEDAFAAQLRWMKDQGIVGIVLDHDWRSDVFAEVAHRRAVALTFDDSHVNHYANSLPLLQSHGYAATFFVVTSLIGQDPVWLGREQLAALARAGMSVQSHTHTHRFLDTLNPADLRDELERSKHLLEDWLGLGVHHLSCPGGRYSRRVLDAAREAGYRTVSTSVPGQPSHDPTAEGVCMLPRFLVTGGMTIEQFQRAARADPNYVRRKRAAYTARRLAKRCLGDRFYQRVWQSIYRSDDGRTSIAQER